MLYNFATSFSTIKGPFCDPILFLWHKFSKYTWQKLIYKVSVNQFLISFASPAWFALFFCCPGSTCIKECLTFRKSLNSEINLETRRSLFIKILKLILQTRYSENHIHSETILQTNSSARNFVHMNMIYLEHLKVYSLILVSSFNVINK